MSLNDKYSDNASLEQQKDGRYRVLIANSPDTPIPFIDPNHDPALFVKALASQTLPTPKSANKVRKFAGYARYTTFAQFVDLLNKHLSGEFYIEEVSVDAWAKEVPIPGFGLELAEMWKYVEKVGYFGGEKGETTIITEVSLLGYPRRYCREKILKQQTAKTIGRANSFRELVFGTGLVDNRLVMPQMSLAIETHLRLTATVYLWINGGKSLYKL